MQSIKDKLNSIRELIPATMKVVKQVMDTYGGHGMELGAKFGYAPYDPTATYFYAIDTVLKSACLRFTPSRKTRKIDTGLMFLLNTWNSLVSDEIIKAVEEHRQETIKNIMQGEEDEAMYRRLDELTSLTLRLMSFSEFKEKPYSGGETYAKYQKAVNADDGDESLSQLVRGGLFSQWYMEVYPTLAQLFSERMKKQAILDKKLFTQSNPYYLDKKSSDLTFEERKEQMEGLKRQPFSVQNL